MKLSLAYRLKTFGLMATVLVALCALASEWIDHAPPRDPALLADTPQLRNDMSSFAQSGGIVPDECEEFLAS